MKKYSILNIEMYDTIEHNKFLHNDYLYNLNKTHFVVTYIGEKPSCISEYNEYTNEEITSIVYDKNSNWFDFSFEL
jgi:hypothetical protein